MPKLIQSLSYFLYNFTFLVSFSCLATTAHSEQLPSHTPADCETATKPAPCYQKPKFVVPPEEGYIAGPLHQPNMKIHAKSDNNHSFYVLPATPATTTWGYFNSSAKPALTIKSGDSVAIETLPGGGGNVAPGLTIEQLEYINAAEEGRGPHTMTGPIYVEGANPASDKYAGDILAIHINKIRMRSYATNNSADFGGLFSEFGQGGTYQPLKMTPFTKHFIDSYYLDNEKMEMEFEKHPHIVVPLNPFPGTLGVARAVEDEKKEYSGALPTPPTSGAGWCVKKGDDSSQIAKCNTKQPGNFGGNLDLPLMTTGSTTYLPVFQKGGLIWTGDSHAAQGNGEIDLDALETAFPEMNVTIDIIHRSEHPEFGEQPVVETKDSWVTVGYEVSLNQALESLKSETIRFLMAKRGISRSDAEQLMVKVWDCPISEVVDEVLGTYCILPKNPHAPRSADIPRHDTKTHWVSYASDPTDLMKAMKKASYASVEQMSRELSVPTARAYRLATFVQDCRIGRPTSSQETKFEVSCMVPKKILRSKQISAPSNLNETTRTMTNRPITRLSKDSIDYSFSIELIKVFVETIIEPRQQSLDASLSLKAINNRQL